MEMYWKSVLVLTVLLMTEGECLSSDLDSLQREYAEWRLQRSPEYSTDIGIYKFNDRLENFAFSGFEENFNKSLDLLNRLKSIEYNKLSPKQQTDFDVLNDTLMTVVRGYDWREYSALNPVNFLEGPQVDPSELPKITPFDTIGDYENYIRRLQLFPKQIDEMISRFETAIEKKHTYHNVSVNRVPAQIDRILEGVNVTTFPFYEPFLDQLTNHTTIQESRKTKMRQRVKPVIKLIIQKYRSLKTFLQDVYFHNLRTNVGVSSWDRGREFYKECLRWYLSLDLSPEEVHSIGLREVERIYMEMKKVMMKLNHQGSVKEFFDKVKADPRFFLQSGDEVIEWYKNAIEKEIKPKLPTLFKNLPDLPLVVKPNPVDGIFGQYFAGPSDGSRPGVFQVNVHHPKKLPTIDFMALALHEANPGHHMQISIASSAKLPKYRKLRDGYYYSPPTIPPVHSAFTEGWALYAESLGEDMQLYKTDYELLGRYGMEMFRACRLVVDTGLHNFNWTREEAIQYLLNYTAFDETKINVEVDRYITWPGQACTYKIGELKIKELRAKAKEELDSKFDIRDFHSTVLKEGALPLHILEKNVNHWIAKTKEKARETTNQCTSGGFRINTYFKIFLIIYIIIFY
ncbi:uncharacterized protein LOC133202365 isoform X1 [Saccostrea echinata]|uniref:uncharacterized protein LOC133202365 isoform X1 n=1 Tax=Saccostrea echinata TaxID=191078 RepID=UPI002A8413C8|nr:uncharacterized protein LOC133202365 isoform X1 [Saccostrea echinata]XP_061194165.1 uncharacterized protein LOC133202365 isoform X1 [Saccostrea echinata]